MRLLASGNARAPNRSQGDLQERVLFCLDTKGKKEERFKAELDMLMFSFPISFCGLRTACVCGDDVTREICLELQLFQWEHFKVALVVPLRSTKAFLSQKGKKMGRPFASVVWTDAGGGSLF